jgi:hypothetical protein
VSVLQSQCIVENAQEIDKMKPIVEPNPIAKPIKNWLPRFAQLDRGIPIAPNGKSVKSDVVALAAGRASILKK